MLQFVYICAYCSCFIPWIVALKFVQSTNCIESLYFQKFKWGFIIFLAEYFFKENLTMWSKTRTKLQILPLRNSSTIHILVVISLILQARPRNKIAIALSAGRNARSFHFLWKRFPALHRRQSPLLHIATGVWAREQPDARPLHSKPRKIRQSMRSMQRRRRVCAWAPSGGEQLETNCFLREWARECQGAPSMGNWGGICCEWGSQKAHTWREGGLHCLLHLCLPAVCHRQSPRHFLLTLLEFFYCILQFKTYFGWIEETALELLL
jgi:hypothetical protein